ncbi:MAG: hypothetical protein IJ069_13115 [Prevotella sp.]|nr:hypothetical protein [Prevotella sp.]
MKRNIIIIQLLMLVLALPVQAQNKNFRQDFEAFKNKAKKEYADFRKKALAEYAQFVREAWEEFGAEPPVEVPKEEKVMPMVTPEFEDETASWFTKLFGLDKKDPQKEAERKARKEAKEAEKKAKKEAKRRKRELTNDHLAVQQVVAAPAPAPKQPQPLAEVVPVPEKANDYMTFDVFGTQCRVRIGDNCRIHLNGLSGDELADAIGEFSKSQYDNMLYDCLQERKNHHFSDWAYYQMLLALTDKFYGKHTNEGTLVMGFLYSQSGYKMRYAHDNSKLYILVASQYNIFKKSFFYVDGECYYLLDNIGDDTKLAICKAKFPKESPLSLQITAVQDFTENPTLERTITSPRNPDFSFTLKSNKNYIDFYNTYPSSYTDNNFMTRWAMYANTPLEKGITAQLYPSMREKLDGMSPLEKVQQLDWWVQGTVDVKRENPDQGCFLYAFDDDVWGFDRAFFGEETFFYPYCDCEDRSILLSHLVRDLVNLDVVLVYYPGHLAMAVNFQEDVPGDYIMVDGRKFTVCDPTYVGSDVGETMPTMKDKSTTVILLQRKG